MVVLMGGSGSTGSSLLKNILNRHSKIFAGEESNLFCKKELYTDFVTYQHRITKRGIGGLKNHGWHIYNGIDLVNNGYPISVEEINNYANQSNTLSQFTGFLKGHLCGYSVPIWLEKTPANATSFGNFLDQFPKGKVIHITRNPLDTIASLIDRGYSLYYAIGIYLINTAAGLKHIENPKCITIKYEDLVLEQTKTVASICDFLAIDFDPIILKSKNENIEVSQLKGWQYDETADIGNRSVGRFNKLSDQKQNEITSAISKVIINKTGQELFQVNELDISSVTKKLGYPTIETNFNSFTNLNTQLLKDRLNRLIRFYPTGLQYPMSII